MTDPRISFLYEDDENQSYKLAIHPGDMTWTELMDEFRFFLNGVGFHVPIGEWCPLDDDEL